MKDFVDYYNQNESILLNEARGIIQSRVAGGEISLTSPQGECLRAVSMRVVPKYLDPSSKQVNPEFTKVENQLSGKMGDPKKAKSLIVLTLKRGTDDHHIGKYTTNANPKDPSIKNPDLKEVKPNAYGRGCGGCDLSGTGFTTEALVKGHRTISVRGQNYFLFTSANELVNRILTNMKASKIACISNFTTIKTMSGYMQSLAGGSSASLDWSALSFIQDPMDKRKIGFYLVAELLLALPVFAGQSFGSFPGFSEVRGFLVPTTSTSPMLDSFMYGTSKDTGKLAKVKISSKGQSKAGKGGNRPSFLSTLERLSKQTDEPLNSAFMKDLIDGWRASGQQRGMKIADIVLNRYAKMGVDLSQLHSKLLLLYGGSRMTADKSKLSKADLKFAKEQILAFQAKVKRGIKIPHTTLKYAAGTNTARGTTPNRISHKTTDEKILMPKNWELFGSHIYDICCDIVIMGINFDTSDLQFPDVWQVSLDIDSFVANGTTSYTAKSLGKHQGIEATHKDRRGISRQGWINLTTA